MKLTPTQDLLVEVLVARRRMGDELWAFDSSHKRALTALETLGVVNLMGGMVENTVRASLTAKAVDQFCDSRFVPRLEEELETRFKRDCGHIHAGCYSTALKSATKFMKEKLK